MGKVALPHQDLVQRHLTATLESVAIKDTASPGGHVLPYIYVLSPGASIPEPATAFLRYLLQSPYLVEVREEGGGLRTLSSTLTH